MHILFSVWDRWHNCMSKEGIFNIHGSHNNIYVFGSITVWLDFLAAMIYIYTHITINHSKACQKAVQQSYCRWLKSCDSCDVSVFLYIQIWRNCLSTGEVSSINSTGNHKLRMSHLVRANTGRKVTWRYQQKLLDSNGIQLVVPNDVFIVFVGGEQSSNIIILGGIPGAGTASTSWFGRWCQRVSTSTGGAMSPPGRDQLAVLSLVKMYGLQNTNMHHVCIQHIYI